MQVSNIFRTFVPARTRQASQRCSNVRVVLFLYISLAEILVFSNDSYFFVNIENTRISAREMYKTTLVQQFTESHCLENEIMKLLGCISFNSNVEKE